MSARWTGYYKIVQPATETMKVADNFSLNGTSYNNYSWYQRLVHGSSSRLSRYQEYDIMDNDVDIARALDLVAEEMTHVDAKTRMPFHIDLLTPEGARIDNNLISTLRAALRHWCIIHSWDKRLFKLCRNTIKYGDLFFRRTSNPSKPWEYINAKNVIAAVVDVQDGTRVIAYQIREDTKKPTNAMGLTGNASSQNYETEIVPASDIIAFNLLDDMSDMAPFGESVLSSVYRVQKQKELLEDAIVIYRVQRAPERRVFYIDVGKMPPQKVRTYLEQIKNEQRQKKVPTAAGGTNQVESTYNPHSMSEDFYFAQRADGKGSRVETLPGGQNLGELTDLEYFRHRVFLGMRIPPSFLPGFNSADQLGAIYNDGKAGVAFMQELLFFRYIERLQSYVNDIIDREFKKFLHELDIHIDDTIFRITLPESTNFKKYKEAALDGELLTQFGNADGVEYLSKRFVLSRYLKLSPEEIAMNEELLKQERGIHRNDKKSIVKLYNPDLLDLDMTDTEKAPSGMSGGGGLDFGASEPMAGTEEPITGEEPKTPPPEEGAEPELV